MIISRDFLFAASKVHGILMNRFQYRPFLWCAVFHSVILHQMCLCSGLLELEL